ncbi:MAG: hypothetical protein E7316_02310 [Clostridiales bacterium]|nr:hypothetical protein [Clostridiales bacterium]
MATKSELLGLTLYDEQDYGDVSVLNDNMTMVEKAMWARSRVWNLLDNSDFTTPVNQRGWSNGTKVTAKKYFIDRWLASADVTPALTSDGIAASAEILQMIKKEGLVGKTVTGALCLSDGTLVVGSGVVPSGSAWINLVDKWHDDTRLLVTSTSEETLRFRVVCGSNVVRWAALYEGAYTADTLPAYQPKGYVAELIECKRYFRKVKGISRLSGYCTSSQANLCLPLDVPMRITPTLTATSLDTIRAAGKNIAITGASVNSMTYDSVRIIATYAADSAVVNHVGVWAVPVFTLDADYQL